MTVHRIKYVAATGRRETFETADRKAAEKRLAEARKTDPRARLLSIPATR